MSLGSPGVAGGAGPGDSHSGCAGPEDRGKPAGAFPNACCSCASTGALGHIAGTSSNTLPMNFLTYSITKKKTTSKTKQNP